MQGKKREPFNYSKPEITYRSLKGLNQSMLAVYDENPLQFYNEFILGQGRKSTRNKSFTIGNIVDFFLLDCHGEDGIFEQRFDEKFVLFGGNSSTGQAYILADNLFEITQRDADEEGTITTGFEERFQEAFLITQAKGKFANKTWQKGLEEFNKETNGFSAKDYFESKLQNIGKDVVNTWEINKAKSMVHTLRKDRFHSDFINQETDSEIEVLRKVVIVFKFRDWECKAELDFIHIHHNDKVIKRRDLKTAFDNESFEYSYRKYYYYLQNAFYDLAVRAFAEQNGLGDYEIEPMHFLVLDSSKNERAPLLYETTPTHVQQGLYGFYHNDIHYRGVYDLIEGISWASDNNIWNISRENYLNDGIVKLKEY